MPKRVALVSITWSVALRLPSLRNCMTVIAPERPMPSPGADPTKTKLRPASVAVASAVGVMRPIPSATPRSPVAANPVGVTR